MATVHHLNCGLMIHPSGARVPCHCLAVEGAEGITLIDAGVGLLDVRTPDARLGQEVVDSVGLVLDERYTAYRELERVGLPAAGVRDIVVTHCDLDHVGGLADFPDARVHVSEEELAAARGGARRYRSAQWAHGPDWRPLGPSTRRWFGLEARPVPLAGGEEALLIPLFGHTLGHCGVAVRRDDRWLLHVGDAYYLRVELETDDHPVRELAERAAEDNTARRASLAELRRLARDHADDIDMLGYHDRAELPFEI